MGTLDNFMKYLPTLSIAHHVPGRIRFKIDISMIDAPLIAEIARLKGKKNTKVRGIISFRVNPSALSCIIEYDIGIIPPDAWEDVTAGKKTPPAEVLKGILEKSYEETIQHSS